MVWMKRKHEFINGDVFKELRTLRDSGRSFDLVILDPPKFAATVAQAEQGRARLQGHQPAGFQAAQAGWDIVHLFLLGRGEP